MLNITILKKQIEYGKLKISVNGISMLPTFKQNDQVFVEKIAEPLKPGNIIFFVQNENYIIHRIICIENEYIITKGDNNRYIDIPVKKENILGIVHENSPTIINQNKCLVNVWKENLYDLYTSYGKTFSLETIHEPDTINEGFCNICVARCSTKTLNEIDLSKINKKICFHVGVNVSNIVSPGMIKDDVFDYVVRATPYSFEEISDIKQNALLTMNSIYSKFIGV